MIEKDPTGLPKVRRAGGPRVVVPLEENAFITRTTTDREVDRGGDETETSPLNPSGLNSGALANVFAKRADDFEDPLMLEITYDDPAACDGRMNEIVFVDPLHDSYRPRMLVSLECVKAMHRAISILTRKVDNLLKTLSVCRTDYLKELTHLREMSRKVKPKEGDRPTVDGRSGSERVRRGRGARHDVFYFSPDLYVDGITVELVHGKIREATESMQKRLDDAQHENALLRGRLVKFQRVGADQQGIEQLRSLALVIPTEQLVIMLKVCAQESGSMKAFHKACKRVVGDDDASDSDEAGDNGFESDGSGISRGQLRRKLSESQKECERLRKQVHGLTESREQILGQLRALHSESLQQKCDRLEGEVQGLQADREALEAVRTENSKLKDILRKFLMGTWTSREHTTLRKSLLETGLVEDSRTADEALRHLGSPVRSRVKPDCADASFQVDVIDIAGLKKGIVDSKLLIMRLQDLVKEKDQQLTAIVEELAQSEEVDKMAVLGSLKATLHQGERTQDGIRGAAESSLDALWKSEDLSSVAKISKRASRNPLSRASTFMNLSVEEILRTRDVGIQADVSFSVARASVVVKPKGRLKAFVKDKLLHDVREKVQRGSRSVSAAKKMASGEPSPPAGHVKAPAEKPGTQRKSKAFERRSEPSDGGALLSKVGESGRHSSTGKLLTWSDEPVQAEEGPAGACEADFGEGEPRIVELPENKPGETQSETKNKLEPTEAEKARGTDGKQETKLSEQARVTEDKLETTLAGKASGVESQVGRTPKGPSKMEDGLLGSVLPETQVVPAMTPDADVTSLEKESNTYSNGEPVVSEFSDKNECTDQAVPPKAIEPTDDAPVATTGAVGLKQGDAADPDGQPHVPRSREDHTLQSAEPPLASRTPPSLYIAENAAGKEADADSSSSVDSVSDNAEESEASHEAISSVDEFYEAEENEARAAQQTRAKSSCDCLQVIMCHDAVMNTIVSAAFGMFRHLEEGPDGTCSSVVAGPRASMQAQHRAIVAHLWEEMCAKSAFENDTGSETSEQGSDGKVELLVRENMLLKAEKKELAEALSRATAVDSNTISLYRTEYDALMAELGRLKCANAELETALLMKRGKGDSEDEGIGSEPCTVRRDELEWLRQQVTAQRSNVAALEVALEAQSASLRSLADRHNRATESNIARSNDQRQVSTPQLTDYQSPGAVTSFADNDRHTREAFRTSVPLPGIVAIEETKLKGLLREAESRSKEVLELRAEVCSLTQMLQHRGTTSEQRDQVVLSRREYADLLGEAQEARQQRTVPDLHREIDAQVYERKLYDLRAQIASFKAQLVAMKLVNNILPVLEKRGLLKGLIEGASGDRLEDIVTVQELKIRDLRRTIANLLCLHRAAKPFVEGLEVVLSAKPIRPPLEHRYLCLEDIKSDDDSTSADESPRLGLPGTGCRLQRPRAFRPSPPIDHSTAVYRRAVGGISFRNFWWKRRLQKSEDAVVDEDVDFFHQEPMLRTGTITLETPAPRARPAAQPRRRRYRGTEERSETNASTVYITIPQPYMYR